MTVKNPPDLFQAGTIVYNRDGSCAGTTTGKTRICRLEGCRGRAIGVRWPDDRRITYPCTAGLRLREDGDWQIS